MDIFQKIAEERILEAIKQGEFDNLSNMGKPLNFGENLYIPEDLRIAYKILKNAGCLLPELELRKEIISLRELIDTIDDDKERLRKIRQLNFKLLKLNMLKKTPFNIEHFPEYEGKILRKTRGRCTPEINAGSQEMLNQVQHDKWGKSYE